jgi:hypothetical protein
VARARGGCEDKGRWFALSVKSVMPRQATRARGSVAARISVTDDSAFKRQVRARMAATGEKYTVARRMVIADHDPGQPPVVVRVYLNPHVDLELTAEAGRAYAAADEQGRREIAGQLLMDEIEAARFEEGRVAASSKIVTDQQLRTEAEAAQDAAIRGAVRRSMERTVGLSAVEVDLTADRVHVTLRAARPGVAWGLQRAAETEGIWRETAAEQLRRELEELTRRQVRLDILQVPGPQEMPGGEGRSLLSR